MSPLVLLVAISAGWLVQLVLAHRQAQGFQRQTASLRPLGTVSVGAAGRRYRGGRAFVALAVDRRGRVRGALVLRGWTTFASPRPLPAAVGLTAARLAGPAPVAGLDTLERNACRSAVELLRAARATTSEPTDGSEMPLAAPGTT